MASATRDPDWIRTVFRLSGIPNGATTRDNVAALVANALGVETDSVNVYSLATTLTPWEMPPSRVATLMLLQSPALLATLKDGQSQWTLRAGMGDNHLVLDTHFRGLTPLNDVTPGKHIADCIAISGLASHAFGSWQPRGNDKTFMWIRDQAPKYVPGMRAILYGYDSRLADSESFQGIGHLALSFISQVRANGGALDDAKPLVFLAHSLGGIVLKDALCKLANSQDNSLERKIFARCKGAIMFGVPNLGMDQNHLLALVRGNSTEHLVRDLSRESGTYGYLNRLELSFSGLAEIGEMTFYWVFETNNSPTFGPGTGKMTGPHAILVDPDSATAHRINEYNSNVHPIARNHSEIVKFTRSDPNTGPIIEFLRRVCGIADSNAADDDAKIHFDALAWLRSGPTTNEFGDSEGGLPRRQLEHLMRSLDSPDLDLRQALIADRFEHTCEWVYEHKPFTSWLRQDSGIFWIHGKPGSGKSTLMKLIYTDKRTWQHSHTFGLSFCHISAGFFFNYRGTSIQKTLEGLMRSILRQIMKRLSESSTTIPLLGILLKSPAFMSRTRDPWPISRLEEALRAILEQKEIELRITFFFDALDEFDGPPDYISRFVKYLAGRPTGSLTYTKVCFSSRPWEDFVTNFSGGPNLSVEDFTKSDIRYFCASNLFKFLDANRHDLVPRLADEVVLRAFGVFLWASLIIKEFIAAFKRGRTPSLEALLELLQSVPTELSQYYNFIIQRIPSSLRWQTYALLEAVVRARSQEELRLDYLWKTVLISDSRFYSAAQEELRQFNNLQVGYEIATKEPERAILLWSGGLVSVQSMSAQLMHQTVYEFVTKLDFKDQVLGSLAGATYENGHTFHFKSILTFRLTEELLAVYPRTFVAIQSSMSHGAEAEETTGRSCAEFLESVPDATIANLGTRLIDYLRNDGGYLSHLFGRDLIQSQIRSRETFATFFRLHLYLQGLLVQGSDYLAGLTRSDNLLGLVALAIGLGDTGAHQRLLLIASFLLENGYASRNTTRITSIFLYALYPHKLVSSPPHTCDSWDFTRHRGCLEAFDQLAALLLEHDPTGAAITISRGGASWCKPIHVAPPVTTLWLLDHKISPNELDSRGITPLDCIVRFGRKNVRYTTLDKERLRYMQQVASIPISRGGHLCDEDDYDWGRFRVYLREEGILEPSFPESAPIKPTKNSAPNSQSKRGHTLNIVESEPLVTITHAPVTYNTPAPPVPVPNHKSPFSRGIKRLVSKWRQR